MGWQLTGSLKLNWLNANVHIHDELKGIYESWLMISEAVAGQPASRWLLINKPAKVLAYGAIGNTALHFGPSLPFCPPPTSTATQPSASTSDRWRIYAGCRYIDTPSPLSNPLLLLLLLCIKRSKTAHTPNHNDGVNYCWKTSIVYVRSYPATGNVLQSIRDYAICLAIIISLTFGRPEKYSNLDGALLNHHFVWSEFVTSSFSAYDFVRIGSNP